MPVIKSHAEVADLTVEEALREFLVDCRIRNLSEQSLEFYKRRLGEFFEPWVGRRLVEVTRHELKARIAEYLDRYSPATVNGYIRCAKALLNWALREEYDVAVDPKVLRRLKESKRVMPHLSDSGQIAALLAQPDRSRFIGLRDYVMLMVMLDTGIRLGELVGLDADDVRGAYLLVRGKGRKERMVALSAPTEKAMMRYLRARARLDLRDSSLVPSVHRRRIAKRSVSQLVKEYGERAALTDINLSPHKLRYTFATHFLRNGGSIVSLQQVLGHTTLAMSRHYAQMVDEDAFEETRTLSPVAAMHSGK
jgi:integrase/recombinase XerD